MADSGARAVCLTRCPLPPPEQNVHALPCKISHDGPAPVKNYFRPELQKQDQEQDKKKDSESPTWRAEFRGIQLTGDKVALAPMGLTGNATKPRFVERDRAAQETRHS